jgi:hypothetical protein
MKGYFKNGPKYKKDIIQTILALLSIGVFFMALYFINEYLDKVQCCMRYGSIGEFGNNFVIFIFGYLLFPYTAFRLTKKTTVKTLWQKIFLSILSVILYLPVIGLGALFAIFPWYRYNQYGKINIFNEEIVGGLIVGIIILLLAYLNYKYILFRKYTFVVWSVIAVCSLGLTLFLIFNDNHIFLTNKIILLLGSLVIVTIIIVDKYVKKVPTLLYLIIAEAIVLLTLVINFTSGLYLHYDYNKTTKADFKKCELTQKKNSFERTIVLVDDGVCLDRKMTCRIIDRKSEQECIKLSGFGYLRFFPAQDTLNQNKKRFWDLRLPNHQRAVVWRYHELIRVTPVLSNAGKIHFFMKEHKQGQYLTDGKYFYYGNRQTQATIDLDTFEYLGWRCAKDKDNFLYQGRIATEKEKAVCQQNFVRSY